MSKEPAMITADTIARKVACPTCTAAPGTGCVFDAFERLGADGKMRERSIHRTRAAAYNARHSKETK